MSKSRHGDKFVEEILEVRNRLRFQYRGGELFSRLREIKHAYTNFDHQLTELFRYFPISLVACTESYFRLAIMELIDSGEPYLCNSNELLKKEKFDFDILKALHGQTVSIGEVISHQLSINSLSQVIYVMNSIMACEFPSKVGEVYDRYKVEVQKKSPQPLIRNKDETFRYVERTFQLRHIFCHELATEIKLEEEEIGKCVDHTIIFLEATDELISQALFPDAPLTQTGMNLASYDDAQREKESLDDLLNQVISLLSRKQEEKFREANEAWNKFVQSSIEIEGLEYEGGSMRPTIVNLATARFVRERKRQIEELLKLLSNS